MPLDAHTGGGGQRKGPHSKTFQHWCSHSARLWPHGSGGGFSLALSWSHQLSSAPYCLSAFSICLSGTCNKYRTNFLIQSSASIPLFWNFLYLFVCMNALFVCICVRVRADAHRDQKSTWDRLERNPTVRSHHVGAGNQRRVLGRAALMSMLGTMSLGPS